MSSRKAPGRGRKQLATIGIIVYSRQYRVTIGASLAGRDGIIPVDLGDGSEESLRRLAHVKPQVLLVDLPSSRLANILRAVHANHPNLPIVAVNCEEGEDELLALFEVGLSGFVPHDTGPEGLLVAIQHALRGEFHCPPRIAAALVRRVNAAASRPGWSYAESALTPREAQVAALLEHSMTNKEIAAQLGIGAETVRNHVYRICRKLHAHRRTEVAARLKGTVPVLRMVRGRARRAQEE